MAIMSRTPIVLVPGFWLGAWAWDAVASQLRASGYDVTAVTLPGLEPEHPDRASVTMADQVEAICAAISANRGRAVLVVHSGAAIPGYGASDMVPDRIAAMVYVDTGPGAAAIDPAFEAAEYPMPSWERLVALGNSLEGLSDDQLAEFRRRAVPEPGAALREGLTLSHEARRNIRSTVVATSFRPHEFAGAAAEGLMFEALPELTQLDYVDLPTGHWPMWSRPHDLAEIIAAVAGREGSGQD